MKFINFWRTLFVSAMAVSAFVACSDDDDEGYSGVPEVSVNGKSSAVVARDLTEGSTEAVSIVSNAPWTLAFEAESAATWCTPNVWRGGAGTTALTFSCGATNVEREAVATVTAMGQMMGVPVPAKVTITIKQNAGGSTEITTNVKAVRSQLTFEQNATTISESIVVTGICVSDVEGNNINNKSIMLTDNTTEPGAGLFIRFNEVNSTIKMGNIVSVELNGGASQSYYGTCQVNNVSTSAVKVLDANDNTPAPIEVTDPSKLIEYQSQYVQVYSQPVESVRGQAYYNVASGYANINFETPNGGAFQLSFNSFSADWAKNVTIPANSGNIKGCVSINNNAGNVSPRNAADLADMTQPLFTVETTSATIDKITGQGTYKVEGVTVVATNLQGFVIADNTGAFYVTRGNGGVVPELGKVITIEGQVGTYGGMLQFDKDAVVTETGSTQVTYPAATVVTAANLQSIVDEKKVVYVKTSGELVESTGFYNWNFDFTPTGTANVGATVYPDATKFGLAAMVGQQVDIEGYFVYTTGNGARFSVVLTSIKADASAAVLKFTSKPSAFAADAASEQTINFNAQNVQVDASSFSLSGADADKFEVKSVAASSVVVATKGANTSDAAYTATLTVTAGGLTDQVTLTQSKPAGQGGDLTYNFSSNDYWNPAMPSAYATSESTHTYTADNTVWTIYSGQFTSQTKDEVQFKNGVGYLITPAFVQPVTSIVITGGTPTFGGKAAATIYSSADNYTTAVGTATVVVANKTYTFTLSNQPGGVQYKITFSGAAGHVGTMKIN